MVAWDHLFTGTCDQVTSDAFRRFFPDNENRYFEDLGFRRLHKVVLGIVPNSLETELNTGSHDIDLPDSHGYSPLVWAIRRNDATSVGLLLKAGADPNALVVRTGSSPLHFAAHGNGSACVKVLLRFGAKANRLDKMFNTPLHYAARRCTQVNVYEDLLAVGVGIEIQNVWGGTALTLAAAQNNFIGTRALLSYGAKIDAQDYDGDAPIMSACWYDADRSI